MYSNTICHVSQGDLNVTFAQITLAVKERSGSSGKALHHSLFPSARQFLVTDFDDIYNFFNAHQYILARMLSAQFPNINE